MKKQILIPIFMLLVSLGLAISSSLTDSLVVDEIPHIGAGYGYVAKADYRLNPEHPPLVKTLAALPILLLKVNPMVFSTDFWLVTVNGQWNFGRYLAFHSGVNADLLTQLVRLPVLIFFILSVFIIWSWTKEKHGPLPAFLATFIFALSPTVLAHARLVTTDVAACFGILAGTYFFLRYLKLPTIKNLIIAGLIFGIAQLTKFSVFLLVPYFLFLALIWCFVKKQALFKKLFTTIIIFAIGYIFIVWPVYLHHTSNYPSERQRGDTISILRPEPGSLENIVVWLSDKPVLRAIGHYGLGLLMVNQRVAGGNTAYFLGEVSKTSWKEYFPIVYAIKEPIPWLILIILSLLYIPIQLNKNRLQAIWDKKVIPKQTHLFKRFKDALDVHFEEIAMLIFVIGYWVMSINGNLNIGIRHLLPTYPFIIMLVSIQISRIIYLLNSRHKPENSQPLKPFSLKSSASIFIIFISVLLTWYAAENISIWPNYITYFNQLVGGSSNGYRYVVDSNLDWGQDLKRLATWVKENNIETIHLDYFGWSDPVYYLGERFVWLSAGKYKNAREFLDANPDGGYIGVSATYYMNSQQDFSSGYVWLESIEPKIVIGNSIFIWEIRPN